MSDRKIVISRSASADMQAAADWYNSRAPGLGRAFLLRVESILNQLLDHPERFQRVQSGYRRAVIGRFPYVVLYRILPDTIRVLGVMPQRQDSDAIKHRVTRTMRSCRRSVPCRPYRDDTSAPRPASPKPRLAADHKTQTQGASFCQTSPLSGA